MQTGKINVQTENIFPVIKKFLYSDHEIFLRELISNAVDATQKLKTLVSLGKADCELGDLTIHVKVNKENKTIHVIDRGIGMTAEEVDKYINQIAFSGAEEFMAKYKGSDSANIIGHFGLGFYSSFMIANKVDILTKSYLNDSQAVKWSCDGSPEFSLENIDKIERGTEIVLHVGDDDLQEFVDENRLTELLNKYCRFLPIPICCGTKTEWRKKENVENGESSDENKNEPQEESVEVPNIINDTDPIWQRQPSSLTDDDYNKFYHKLYPISFEEPMFHIHLNVDYPFNLTGVLYFPKIKNQLDLKKNKVQLYCNQVFITDELEGIVPDFMNLLHGVIDSPDIPLNVSRSYLQSDGNVKKISTYISKKVAEKLEEMFKNNREDFEKKWDDLSVFLQYGSLTDEKFYEKIKDFYLLKNVEGKYFTIEEYKNKISTLQTDKSSNVIFLYASSANEQHVYIRNAQEKGYDVLLMNGIFDAHYINMLEQKMEKIRFTRVDSNVTDKLIEKEDEAVLSKLSSEQEKQLKEYFDKQVDTKMFTPEVVSLSETDLPVIVTQNEFMRRFKDMEKVSGQQSFYGNIEHYNLVVNGNHELSMRILNEADEEKRLKLVQQLIDLAMLSQNILTGEKLSEFVKRSYQML